MTVFEEQATKYIRRIRNDGKRRYADRYLAYLLGRATQPDSNIFRIDGMAAQAVRMELHSLAKD